MADERYEYRALRPIDYQGRLAYQVGHGLSRQVVADLGLQVGVDVEPVRPDVELRPADDASRAEWARYALGQGMELAEVEQLGRDGLRDRFPQAVPEAGVRPEVETVAEPMEVQPQADEDLGDDVPAGNVDEVLAWVGDDEARAVLALQAERARDRPRSGVVGPLNDLIGDDGEAEQ